MVTNYQISLAPCEPTTPVAISPTMVVAPGSPLLVIAGPCQIESREHALRMAEAVIAQTKGLPIQLVFKASFDKANRTSLSGARGVGIDSGLSILAEIKKSLGIPVLTDVHTIEQIAPVSAVVDVLQTPAFLCRQTDFLLAVGRSQKPINVKKGQFLHPEDMGLVAAKIASTGNKKIMLCERGACFGYRDLVVDMRSLPIMSQSGYPVIFDATHSVQSMGGAGGSSGGSREFIPALARAAVACGVSGVFIETHDDPDRAPSDGASMLPLDYFGKLVTTLSRLHHDIRR